MKTYHIETKVSKDRNPMFLIKDEQGKLVKVYNNATDAMYKVDELNTNYSLSISLHDLLTDIPYNILESVN